MVYLELEGVQANITMIAGLDAAAGTVLLRLPTTTARQLGLVPLQWHKGYGVWVELVRRGRGYRFNVPRGAATKREYSTRDNRLEFAVKPLSVAMRANVVLEADAMADLGPRSVCHTSAGRITCPDCRPQKSEGSDRCSHPTLRLWTFVDTLAKCGY